MTTIEIECKKIFVMRCLSAVVLGIAMQYFLLTIFLLFVNFDVIHPFTWLTETIGLIFSFYTWLCIMPLISAVILFGFFIGNSYLIKPQYYPTRFSWICSTAIRKSFSFFIHGIVGFLTAWLYTRFLHQDYRVLIKQSFDGYYLNSFYTFLTLNGIYAGIYYFVKEGLAKNRQIEFATIQQTKYIQIRSQLFTTLYSSMIKSFLPTVGYVLIYWAIGWIINSKLAYLFNVKMDDSLSSLFLIFKNLKLLFYVWILSSQIVSNMTLMMNFFSILLSEQYQFQIEKDPMISNTLNVTIVEALALQKVPIAKMLASLDLYKLSQSGKSVRRRMLFSLSVPGGHPYNWNQLSAQCLSMISAFTDELKASVKNISSMKTNKLYDNIKPTATEAAEKILLRQYNDSFGIRNMLVNRKCKSNHDERPPIKCQNVTYSIEKFMKNAKIILRSAFYTIPGLYYLFGEQDGAKTAYILSTSLDIVWITQGLAGICCKSLVEDKYGVVQNTLPEIIKALLILKYELDKLTNVNLNGKKFDRNLIVLKNAIKRSLYRICTDFGDYLRDVVDEPDEIRCLQSFANYQEI